MKSFVYLHSTDLLASRRFYTEVVGLEEIYYSEDPHLVGYRLGTMQLTIAAHDDVPSQSGWARQLGWDGGTGGSASWGFELDATSFAAAVGATLEEGVPTWRSEPSWVGYWSFPVRDPMGNTIELTTPDRDSWPSVAT